MKTRPIGFWGNFGFGSRFADTITDFENDRLLISKKDFGIGGDFVFESLPIEGPLSVNFNMIDAEEFHRGIMMDAEEGRVDGSAGQDFLSGFPESSGGE